MLDVFFFLSDNLFEVEIIITLGEFGELILGVRVYNLSLEVIVSVLWIMCVTVR